MAYIGNSLTQQSFTGGMDQFNGNASNTAFGLSRTITTPFDIEVYVESIFQRPGVAYTVSANTINFTSAPSAGSNNVVVVYKNFTATSIVPQDGSVTTNKLSAITNINAGVNAGLTLQANNTTLLNIAANGSVIANGSITAANGLYSQNTFTGSYADGIVVDYTNGMGRISVGANDGVTIYKNGPANTAMLTIAANGNVGIANTTPTRPLDISGSDVSKMPIGIRNTTSNTLLEIMAGGNTAFSISGWDSSSIIESTGGGTGTGGLVMSAYNGPFIIQTNNRVERFRVNANGHITTPYQPAFMAPGASSGTLTAGTKLTWNGTGNTTTQFVRGNCFDDANDRFIAPVDGIYVFHLTIYTQSATSSVQSFCVLKNGAQLTIGDNLIMFASATGQSAVADNQLSTSFMLKLVATEYVEIAVRAGAPSVVVYSGHSHWSGFLAG